MNNSLCFFLLLLRLSIGALALALGLLTLTALLNPDFAQALAAQGMPTPSTWPAALVECGLAVAAFFLHGPRSRSPGAEQVRPTAEARCPRTMRALP